MKKIFIDGKDGTTGLKIYSRFENRDDIELLLIDPEKRKDARERARLINESDYTFLCLPDAASIEAVSLVENDGVTLIDTSTAHRTNSDWAYGFAELSPAHRQRIAEMKRIAVPGCYASGFNSIVYPLVSHGFIDRNYDVVCYAMSGYTGAGKKGIAQYEDKNRSPELDAPRMYALTQEHKHLREMKAVSGISKEPIFSPFICDYPRGMLVSIALFPGSMTKRYTKKDIREMLAEHYDGSKLVKVRPLDYTQGMLSGNAFAERDDMELEVNGNEDRIIITSRFDNLGKGASGAAIQCLNISMGIEETTGLNTGE